MPWSAWLEKLPDGVTVSYEYTGTNLSSNGKPVNAGEYTVTAKFIV